MRVLWATATALIVSVLLATAQSPTIDDVVARLDAYGNVRVEFDRDPKLEMLVPVEMRESFTLPPPASGTSVATYTNFRRCQTSARIVPTPGAR